MSVCFTENLNAEESDYHIDNIDTFPESPNGSEYYKKKKFVKKKKKKRYGTEPITSYGLILHTAVNDKPVFLLYQRRDNFEYMDFLRGVWVSEGQLPGLFSLMSPDERKRIREYTFQELWNDLWVEHSCRIFRDGFSKAKRKYDSVRDKIPELLDTTTSHIREPPWGFPKGKKNSFKEESTTCAIREFTEETRIPSDLICVTTTSPFVENFKGSNGKSYSTHYYLAKIGEPVQPQIISTPHCIRKTTISEEAINVKWFTYEESSSLLNSRRQTILRSALDIINRNNDELT
uniref:NUDIX hydrolase n=1 Tax=Marseillevirus LCMAC101 TaxID=2506602 RepID=A0A481YRZ1_9VIRU|nr:MAG: NUDIX hydrolase [Marseillevirus LCMAC101]